MSVSAQYRPKPVMLDLGEGFFDEVSPASFPRHTLRFRNQRWASRVGLGELDAAEWEAHFAAFSPLPSNLPNPLALRYHGHQFDVYNPDLGDGRGFLFAQLADKEDDRLLDLGTKGSGRTPWSRGGDGRLTLKGGVREVLATEMLEALGVSTSKSFSLFETGEQLSRGDEPSPTRSAVLVRLGHSHLRFGSFQRLAYLKDEARLERLLTYALAHYFPHIGPGPQRVADFLVEVTRRTALLTARWMVAGFVHGVLNSDNMTITGESFDYGPYRFLPTYDPDLTAAYFDHQGLYAYKRQPVAVMRNLVRLAGALRPLAPHLDLAKSLEGFEETLHAETTRQVLARVGRLSRSDDADAELIVAVFAFLEESDVGFDRFFFDAHRAPFRSEAWSDAAYRGASWERLQRLLSAYASVHAQLPEYYQGAEPVTLVIDEVEAVWAPIAKEDDWSRFQEKLERIREMPCLD